MRRNNRTFCTKQIFEFESS
uniref:Uncharacterized protein n=1 Tax=Heterorhabditis bacteriophora TaxID=37862 RepID=A0A1I7WHE1_HETBA